MTRGFEEVKKDLNASIAHQVFWLTSIQKELADGTYTQSKASSDTDAALYAEGFNWLSILEEMAQLEEEENVKTKEIARLVQAGWGDNAVEYLVGTLSSLCTENQLDALIAKLKTQSL